MNRKAFTLIELLVVIAIVAIVTGMVMQGCNNTKQKALRDKTLPSQSLTVEVYPDPIPYGNGVYYFKETGPAFPKALSDFLTVHTNLEVATIASDVQRQNTVGYAVVFRERVSKPQLENLR